MGSLADMAASISDVRLPSESGYRSCCLALPVCAMNGHRHRFMNARTSVLLCCAIFLFGLAEAAARPHHRMMQVREATVEDAEEACRVLRRSIVELCVPDHRNDPIFLEKWLSNKTPDKVRSWILHPNSRVFVAAENGVIVGVGAVTDQGEVTLNYVSPDTRFKGVSKAILSRIELEALALGNATCALTSTDTARRFYLSAGYVQEAADNRMVKRLSPAAPAV